MPKERKYLLKLYPEMTITHNHRDLRFKLRILLLFHYELYFLVQAEIFSN